MTLQTKQKESRLRGTARFPFELYEMRTNGELIDVSCHWQDDMEILYVYNGIVEVWTTERTVQLAKDEIAFISPRQMHGIKGLTSDASYDAYVFPLQHLTFEKKEEDESAFLQPLIDGLLMFPLCLDPCSDLYYKINLVVRKLLSVNREKRAGFQLLTKAYLLELIAAAGEAQVLLPCRTSPQDDTCRRILAYIDTHYSEKITIQTIAAEVGLSHAYFSAFFSEHFRRGFSEYLLKYRLEQAQLLLDSVSVTITDIAYRTGFSSVSYFIDRFKLMKGCTPYQYRKKRRDGLLP